MGWMWPFGTMIRRAPERPLHSGRKRNKARAKASRQARRANR